MANWKPETIARRAARLLNPEPQKVERFRQRAKSKSWEQPLAVRILARDIYASLLEKHKDKVALKGHPYKMLLQGTATSLARAKLGLTMSMSERRRRYNLHKYRASFTKTVLGLQDPIPREGNGVKDMLNKGRAARAKASEMGLYLHENNMAPAPGRVKEGNLEGV